MRALVIGLDLARWLRERTADGQARIDPRPIAAGPYADLYAVPERVRDWPQLEAEAPDVVLRLRALEAVDLDPLQAWPAD